MTWIRSPAWDSCWILSAPLMGLITMFALVRPIWWVVFVLLTLNLSHAVAPIVLAWSHREYRQLVMLSRPIKFIGWPVGIAGSAAVVILGTLWMYPNFRWHRVALENINLQELDMPMVWWINVYAIWNFYHAGAQNFGILCLYRRRSFPGTIKYWVLAAIVAVTVFVGHSFPRLVHIPAVSLFVPGFLFVNHWLAAIGLSAHVDAQHNERSPWWFVAVILIPAAVVSYAMMKGMGSGVVWLAITIACARAGLGMWHFLQDKWIWQLSDPRVRATIGKELFA